jgi:hypothetical protein
MAAEVLVMCGKCGMGQPAAGGRCAGCGTPFPGSREAVLDAFAPLLEVQLGGGTSLSVSQKRLELRRCGSAETATFSLAQLESVQLVARPVYESLLFVAALLGLAWAISYGPLRLAFSGLALLFFVACFLSRRYSLVLLRRGGMEEARIAMGVGRKNTSVGQRVESVWASLSEELTQLGLPCTRRESYL